MWITPEPAQADKPVLRMTGLRIAGERLNSYKILIPWYAFVHMKVAVNTGFHCLAKTEKRSAPKFGKVIAQRSLTHRGFPQDFEEWSAGRPRFTPFCPSEIPFFVHHPWGVLQSVSCPWRFMRKRDTLLVPHSIPSVPLRVRVTQRNHRWSLCPDTVLPDVGDTEREYVGNHNGGMKWM